MTLTKGQKVSYTFYGKSETATIERVANDIVWLDNGRWMHAESVSPVGRSKQAKARKLGETVGYRVYLIGQAWGGFEGTYSYSFNHLPTEQEITQRAGDFQSVTDYEITQHRTIHYTDGERTIVKTIQPWKREESIDIYCDANGC